MFDPEVLQILGLNLLAGKSPNFAENLGNAGLATMQYQRQREEDKYRKEEREFMKQQREMQIQQLQRQQRFQDALAGGFRPGIAADPLTPMDDEGNPMPSSRPTMDFSRAMQIDPFAAMKAEAEFRNINKPPAPISVPEGTVLLDATTRQPVFQNPKPKDAFRQLTEAEIARLNLPPGIGYQVNTSTGKIDAVGSRAPVTNITNNMGDGRFKDSLTLKKDFDSQPEVKGFKEVRQAWDQISTALANPSGANDLAAATKFMKLLDPGSVVRESELAMAMQSTGALDRFTNYHKQLLEGQKLTPNQRKDFFAAGKALHDAAKLRYDQTVNQFQGIAKQYELDPTFIARGDVRLVKNTTKLVEGRQAIAQGVPREVVAQRLIDAGFDPEGL
jgi:hypothetical protein